MNVLVIGSGGREHAIVVALKKSPKVTQIFAAPGNAGIAQIAECLPISDTNVAKLATFAAENRIDLTVVGPEAALAAGVVDVFESKGLKIFGPTRAAAQIESSKEFAKNLMKKYHIPTAKYEVFSDYEAALSYVRSQKLPIVIKFDGLAAGKGVVIAKTLKEVDNALKDMLLRRKFGQGKVVIEEFMTGQEFSLMCFVNGKNVYPMPLAQDHKRAFDGDCGPNTGGMGAYSPLPFITQEDEKFALQQIMQPMAAALVAEDCPFCGVLYGGLMKTPNGIKVVEFNARFGDPESEVVLPLLKSDIFELFLSVIDRKTVQTEWDNRAALGIVLASKGYPENYDKGFEIRNLDTVDAQIFHMGTKSENGKIFTDGGRVLFVTVLAETIALAREKANREVAKIVCENLFHRTDIGWQAT